MSEIETTNEATGEAREARAPTSDDPMQSVRLLRIAFVHLTLRCETPAPATPLGEDLPDDLSIEEFRFGMTRHIASWLGQPQRCGLKECRRARRCRGVPPDCWRAEPPPSPLELGLAKGLMRYHLDRTLLARVGENAEA